MDVWNNEQTTTVTADKQAHIASLCTKKQQCWKKTTWQSLNGQLDRPATSEIGAARASQSRRQHVWEWDSDIPTDVSQYFNEMKPFLHPNLDHQRVSTSLCCTRLLHIAPPDSLCSTWGSGAARLGVSWRQRWPIFGVSPSHSLFSTSPPSITPALSIN